MTEAIDMVIRLLLATLAGDKDGPLFRVMWHLFGGKRPQYKLACRSLTPQLQLVVQNSYLNLNIVPMLKEVTAMLTGNHS